MAHNPYHQPEHGQPNPYRQPAAVEQPPAYAYPPTGQGQPNPYRQPLPPHWPGPPPPTAVAGPPQRRAGLSTATVAVLALTAVLLVAAATAAVVLTHRGDEGGSRAGSSPTFRATGPAAAPTTNPRGGPDTSLRPSVTGWKVVVNPKYGTAFDVPPGWKVFGSGTSWGIEEEGGGRPVVSMSGPAALEEKWCVVDADENGYEESHSLAAAGTKGGMGAKSTAEAARSEAGNWAWAPYAQRAPKGTVRTSSAVPYSTASGLTGHLATATATGVRKDHRCATDGKAFAFSFKNAEGDFVSWVLHAPKDVPAELPDSTIQKVLTTVRLTTVP
ncbi:hypothetical protein [Streptomyces sp. NPDC006879]|uniref:hypothetical protein n=1 Tax=Streptomyces sp. NPDC006879 TaxID=3364767 RepID=UPI003688DB10